MISSGQVKGIITYLTKLTHAVDMFRFKFDNVEYKINSSTGKATIEYDVYIESKEKDIIWLWDFFHCKSKHILEEACGVVSASFGDILPIVKYIYLNGFETERYGGYVPESFITKVDKLIQQRGKKQILTHFFCEEKRIDLRLNVTYGVSDIYAEDGLVTNISVYCNQVIVDGESLENIPQDIAETIVGYVSEEDTLKHHLEDIVWEEVTKYMNLGDCELWTHTYTFIRNIGDTVVEDFNYISHSTFSSKLCSFISGDY
jgi:hypothetical protein